MNKYDLIKQIECIKSKLKNYDKNSIMGVHYSSKLAGLERLFNKMEQSK